MPLTANDLEPVGHAAPAASQLGASDLELVEQPPSQNGGIRRFASKASHFASTVAGEVGSGLKNVAQHPVSFAEGLIPGASEAQKAYSEGLTPEQTEQISAPTNVGMLARFGLLTPERVEEEERKARENARAIAQSPVRRALVAGLSPEAAPLQIAEYAAAGKVLSAAESIPGAQKLVGTGARKLITEGAALGAGFQSVGEAKRALQGNPNTPSQTVADMIASMAVGGTLGAGFGLPEYLGRLGLRGKITKPIEEASDATAKAGIAAPETPPTVTPVPTLSADDLEPVAKAGPTEMGPEPAEAAQQPAFVDVPPNTSLRAKIAGRGTAAREWAPAFKNLNTGEVISDPNAATHAQIILTQAAKNPDFESELDNWQSGFKNAAGKFEVRPETAGKRGTEAIDNLSREKIQAAGIVEPTRTTVAALETVPGARVQSIPIENIKTAAQLYQYKTGSNAEGAGLSLNKSKKFNEQLGGVVTVIPDENDPGKFFIVNGHQRLALARRTGHERLDAQILPAGTTPAEARAIGARINIAEGRGTSIDAAKFMRDTGTTPEQLASEGMDLSESMSSEAVALAKLSDPIFQDVATGKMKAGRGAVIGGELGDNLPAQDAILKSVRSLEASGQSVSDAKLGELIRIAKGSENYTETQTDLFGTRELKKSYAPQQADILAYIREQLGRDKRLFGTVVRGKGRLEQGGTQVDAATATGISEGAATRQAMLDASAYRSGTESNGVIRKFAKVLADTPKSGRAGVLQDAYAEIYDALERDFGAQKPLGGVAPEAGPGQGNLLTGEDLEPAESGTKQIGKRIGEQPNLSAADLEPAPPSKGHTDLGGAMIPGAREFVERDVVPMLKETASAVKETKSGLTRMFAPASVSDEAFTTAAVISRGRAELANDKALVERGLATFKRAMVKFPESAKDEFIDRMERDQQQRTPELQQIADTLRVVLDKHRDEIQTLGKSIGKPLLDDFYKNYFPHLWKDPQGVEEFYQGRLGPRGSLSGRASFLKARTFDYYGEARAMGFEPVSDNPVELVALKTYEMAKYASGIRIMQDLKGEGLLKFVKFGENPPPGYARINDKLARVYRPAEIVGKEIGEATDKQAELSGEPETLGIHETHQTFLPTGEWYGPNAVSRIVDRYLSPGLRSHTGESPTNAYDALRAAANVANQVQLGMSAFHVTTTTANSGVSELALALQKAVRGDIAGAGRSFVRSTPGVALVSDIAGPGRKMYRQFYGLSDYGPLYQKAVSDYIKSGANFENSRQFMDNWSDSFRDALAQHNVIGAAVRAPFAALEQISKPIFQYIVPRAKAAGFFHLNEFEQSKLPESASEMDRIKTAYQVQNSMDNRFGELQYDKLFWDNRWKDIAFAALRAPGWLLGTARELGGGVADIATGKGLTGRAAYTVALPVWTAIWGSVLQFAATGTLPHITSDARETFRNLFAPAVGKDDDGKPIRVWLPTYMKEVYHLGAALEDLYHGQPSTAGSYAAGKLNPVVQLGTDIATNRTYPDVQVRDPEAPLSTQAGQIMRNEGSSLLPFTVQNLMREKQAGQSTGSAGTLSSLGITPAPRSLSQSDFENYVDRKLGARSPDAPKTEAQIEHSHKEHQAIAALRQGQSIDPAGLNDADMAYIVRQASAPALVDRAKRLSLTEVVDGLRYATPAEKTELIDVINSKLERGFKNLSPAQQQHVLNQLNAEVSP